MRLGWLRRVCRASRRCGHRHHHFTGTVEFAQKRIATAGLSDLVEIRLCDYRDVEGSFDHVVSIEMIEAVGESYWPVYFERIARCVRRGGRVAIQAITTHDEHFAHYRRRADFIQTYIFPGGMLPCRSALREQAHRVGLKWLQDDGFALTTRARWVSGARSS